MSLSLAMSSAQHHFSTAVLEIASSGIIPGCSIVPYTVYVVCYVMTDRMYWKPSFPSLLSTSVLCEYIPLSPYAAQVIITLGLFFNFKFSFQNERKVCFLSMFMSFSSQWSLLILYISQQMLHGRVLVGAFFYQGDPSNLSNAFPIEWG